MKYFITGGTGTLGHELTRQLYDIADKIIIYSRDEAKHADMQKEFPEYPDNKMRYIIGDICDEKRLSQAMQGADFVYHTAAMKHIDKCTYNPTEAIRVNVIGTMNVAQACRDNNVKSAWFISTDKACGSISLYGSTKSVGEHMWVGFNNIGHSTKFNVVRYGNVLGSRGSFITTWDKLAADNKPIPITHKDMTRFFWTVEDAVDFLLKCDNDANTFGEKGCIYIPKMDRSSIYEMAKNYCENVTITGLRCPEKIHEDLILESESLSCYENDDYYIIYPMQHDWSKDCGTRGAKVNDGFSINSRGA